MWNTVALSKFLNKVTRWGQQDLQLSSLRGEKKALHKTFNCVGPSETARRLKSTNPTVVPHYSTGVATSKSKLDQYENGSKTTFIHSNDVDKKGGLKP